ncbi:acyl-CoA synthetase [Celeribacter sp.]|uniref:acyl-CoA synthetase n=1 Tax=Celeribacter sp. TaxID=1890673 RepID=UPI003A8F53D2
MSNARQTTNIFKAGLEANAANYVPLTPVSFIERAAVVHPDALAVVHGDVRRTWFETHQRVLRLASALQRQGVATGDTVSIIATNIPELFEAHFGVPMAGAVLNAINTRLDPAAIAFILDHAETKVLIVDPEFSGIAHEAIGLASRTDLLVIDIEDPCFGESTRIGAMTYAALLESGDSGFIWEGPASEWDAIALNYTSGTTGDPKGVVYNHRGAFLNALSHIVDWGMPHHSVYLWTLPMFHCNGWCFPWTIAANAGVNVCLRAVREAPIFQLIKDEGVTHFCGAPIVLNMLANAQGEFSKPTNIVKVMTAGATPPPAVIQKIEAMGFEVTHVYGLTEVYGPAVISVWKPRWNNLGADDRARLKARQGVGNTALNGLMIADPDTLERVPSDGQRIGEIFLRGNNVMCGYLKNPSATQNSLRGGWFASGDLGVMHPDGYVELKDRSKDIIISGGENISSVEIENVLYQHPDVLEAAVVARPDDKWGETPCAFVTLKSGKDVSPDDIIRFCRANMAGFKVPKTVSFGPLPKTSTGKIQKFLLRDRARSLG